MTKCPASVQGSQHAEDLSAIARRTALPEPERRRFDMCLAASDSLRCLHQVGLDFDQMCTALESDQAITERLASLARERLAHAPPLARARWAWRKMGWPVSVGVSLLAMGAGAAIARLPFKHAIISDAAARVAMAPAAQRLKRNRSSSLPESPLACSPACSASAASAPAAELNSTVPARSESQPRIYSKHDPEAALVSTPAANSAELFSSANAARRSGEFYQAISLYRRLQSVYPRSPETALSYVLLARLELARGEARIALTQFDEYLHRVPGGSLAQEALQGKAEALGRLGRRGEENEVWRNLLSRYPTSVYAATARERLGASQ